MKTDGADRTVVCSFVIPVRNDARRLRNCLAAVRRNGIATGAVEIIVVDNGSTDGSAETARECGAAVICAPRVPVGTLRNLGARRARGEILAFIDADHEIGDGWVETAVDRFRDPGVAAVGALYHPPVDATWVQTSYDDFRDHAPGCREVTWLASGNLAVRRHSFEAAGGFDESLEACEDVDLCRRLIAYGGQVLSDEGMRSVHFGDPTTLGQLFRGELWRGRDNLRVTFRWPMTARDAASAFIPTIGLLGLGVAVLGAIAAPWSGWTIPLLGVLAFACPIVLRAWRMAARRGRRGLVGIARTLLVVFAYDLARALALVVRMPHRSRYRQPLNTAAAR
jgi:hypothetical protein